MASSTACIALFLQVLEGKILPPGLAGAELGPQGLQLVQVLPDHGLGEPELGHHVHGHAPRLRLPLEEGHGITLEQQVPGRRQAGRAAAHNGDPLGPGQFGPAIMAAAGIPGYGP